MADEHMKDVVKWAKSGVRGIPAPRKRLNCAKAGIMRAALWIAEHLIDFVDILEAMAGVGIVFL